MSTITLRRPTRPIPTEYRSIFIHFYLDIAWYGILSGSAIAFVAIYATRLGAEGWQLGLLSAMPAIVGLFITLPVGRWLENRQIGRTVFWMSIFFRLGYLPWPFLPLLFNPQGQVWALILLTFLMSVPGTALAVGFNALFASGVPPEWRGHVVGTRNALLALTYIGTSLLCGWLLSRLSFPLGYQVVFGFGFIGAALSSLHLWFVQTLIKQPPMTGSGSNKTIGDSARPGQARSWGDGLRSFVGLRFLTRSQGRPLLNTKILKGPYGRLTLLLLTFHLAQYLAIPLFPLYWVNQLHLADQQIGQGTALFYVCVFFGSTQLDRLVKRLDHHRITAIGVILMSLYPFLTALTHNFALYMITSAVGGLAWSLVGGAMGNYLLERIPEDDRPAHLAWYHLALYTAILLGSLGGPLLANLSTIVHALVLAAALRLLSALAIWRWG
ncbi:MAG: MFS transporter [Candidatus Promineifilaceae bacterium]